MFELSRIVHNYLLKMNSLGGHLAIVIDELGVKREYDSRTHPMIFIGGHPRSGTTLLRAMLDAHKMIRRGEETRIIPRILELRSNWYVSENELHRLAQAGITDEVVDSAVAAFVLETIVRHGPAKEILCNKDPLALREGDYLTTLFPQSRWIFMIRDGRAVIHSVIKRLHLQHVAKSR